MGEKVRIGKDELMHFCMKILRKIGMPDGDARIVADSLVFADLRGVYSHGTIRFPHYVRRLEDGGTKLAPKPRVLKEAPATAVLDGDNGMGQVVCTRGMDLAVEKAGKSGIGFVTINNSCHFGTAAYYALQAQKQEMIGVVWSNGTNVMAPWGGAERKICNNPLAVAIPAGRFRPLVLDMAMSRVAGGKVRLAKKNNEKIPTDWIVDKEGKPTDRPEDLEEGGALMAMGHKGYGLAIVGEVLSGVLSGAALMSEIPLWFAETTTPTNLGHMAMALDIEKFVEPDLFRTRVDRIIEDLKSSATAEGYDEVLVPGEPEDRTAERQKKEGIALSGEVVRDLDQLAEKYDMDGPKRLRKE